MVRKLAAVGKLLLILTAWLYPVESHAACNEIRSNVTERAVSLYEYRLRVLSLQRSIEDEAEESERANFEDQLDTARRERKQLIRRIEEDGKRFSSECNIGNN